MRAAALKAAQDIVAKAKTADRDLTAEETTEVEAKMAEVKDLDIKIEAAAKSADLMQQVAATAPADEGESSSGDHLEISDRQEKADRRTFGERFTKSPAYGAFRKEFPKGPSNGSPVNIGRVKVAEPGEWGRRRGMKALTFPQAHTQPVRFPTMDQVDRDRLTLLDLIDTSGHTDGDFEYLQVTGVTRNAKIVGELTAASPAGDLKPVSEIQTALADAKVFTYADGYDVTNKLLANAPAFATYMNGELTYSLDDLIEEKLLNGTGVAGDPKGILSTSGVQQQTYVAAAADGDGMPNQATVKAFIRATRLAILRVTRLPGGTVTAIVLSPEMDAAIDLLEDADGRYIGQGPFGSGPGTLWGRPRVASERLVWNQSILGDWRQVALLDNEGLSVLVFNQHKDYAQRNLNYVRAELSAAQVIWKPNRLVVIKPAA